MDYPPLYEYADSGGRHVRFGPFRLNVRSGELFRDDRLIHLPPQGSKLLLLLVESGGELLGREEIQEALWGVDTFVDFEHGIHKCINQIRAALGDDAEKPAFVETVARRGYRFLGKVEVDDAGSSEREKLPYPGLSSFEEKDAAMFFGREREVESLWAKIEKRKLLGLIGPSGVGKSSFLQAGLVASRPGEWRVVSMNPGSAPGPSLTRALLQSRPGKEGRAERTLLLIDQFEELFTLNPVEVQRDFADTIGRLSLDEGVHVLLSMRDDFLFQCHDHEALSGVFLDLTPLGPPKGESLRRALMEPARACGYEFESLELVGEMLREVEGERGALPLLAFAASQLWDKRDGERRRLTRKAYEESGRVGGALARHAEAVLEGFGSARLPMVRELFRNLVTAQGTRASRDMQELLSIFPEEEERKAAQQILLQLVGARLLTSYETSVEIIHESLLGAWPRLVQWRNQDEGGALLRDQLRQAAQVWQERGKREDLLWTGSSYRELALWRERYEGGLTAAETQFVDASTKLAGQKRRRRRMAVTFGFAALLAVLVVVLASRQQAVRAALRAEGAKLLALGELRLAEDPTESLAYATASLELADTEEARVFAMKALWDSPPAFELVADSEAVRAPAFSPDGKWLATAGFAADALVWSEDGSGPLVLPGHETSPRGGNLAKWASKDLLVTGRNSEDSRVYLWSLPEGRRVRTIEFGKPSYWQVGSVGLLAETVESGSIDEPVSLLLRSWPFPDGEPVILGSVDWRKFGARRSLFAPDGKSWLYIKDEKLYARPLPFGTGEDHVLARIDTNLSRLSTSSDQLVIGAESGDTHIYSFSEGLIREKRIPVRDTATRGTLPDPSSQWLIGDPANDRQIRLWDATAWREARPFSLRRSGSWYGSVASVHPLGNWVVASTHTNQRLTFWPLGKTPPAVVEGYKGVIRPMAFSPDSKWLATTGATDDELRLFPVGGSTADVRPLPLPDADLVTALAFDPKGRYLFAVGISDGVWVVPLDGGAPKRLQALSEETLLWSAAVSPSGRFGATAFWYGGGEKTLRIWNLESGELRRFELPGRDPANDEMRTGYERGVYSIGFAGESTLYTTGYAGLVRWDLDTGAHEILASSQPGGLVRGAFSESGRVLLHDSGDCARALLRNLADGTSREVSQFGECGTWSNFGTALDPSGMVAATGTNDGIVRVGLLSGGEPHLLLGHRGTISSIAISPDRHWVATAGEDNTFRLWPMPDLSKPALHTLPHDELLAKLHSLTNFRVVRDRSAPDGWKLEIGPFPGWKNVPIW
ncbi:MAG TPA: winged helix-turn-helix domain-containing protein [Vicinamibacteria bacterium]|nr:winged helix-turn-helix domain-containing protein [Vicinamibacteria bacterium]